MLLGVIRCVTNRLSVLLLSVASPHAINRYLARKEVVRPLFKHCRMAEFHSDLVILAVSVSVTKKTNFIRIWNDLFDIHSNLVLASTLLPIVERRLFEGQFVMECRGIGKSARV